MIQSKNVKQVITILMFIVIFSCNKSKSISDAADIEEIGQQVGDMVASVDEAGGSSGTLGMMKSSDSSVIGYEKMFKRLSKDEDSSNLDFILERLFEIKKAVAATCASGGATYATCSSGVKVKDFNSCTVGAATFAGTVTLTWSNGGSCSLGAANDYIVRVPNFTVTGLKGATLAVTKTGSLGQVLTWSSGSGSSRTFTLTNDGIQRKFTTSSGVVLYNHTTSITSPISVVGTSRSSRTMNGGTMSVKNNLTDVTCSYSPSNVSWSTGCNCPTSGSFSGTCTDGTNTSLQIASCGKGTLTKGSDSSDVTFDRCE